MPWNPDVYNRFKDIRYQPFFDLMNLISENGLKDGVDIGCGTGEQTSMLADKFEKAVFLGVDASPEMLLKSSDFENDRLRFENCTIESFIASSTKSWDLIFSNAALQWTDNHFQLFPQLIACLAENGQLAVQMPVQNENLLNKILLGLVQEEPFSGFLNGWKRTSPVLSMDEYAQILFDSGLKEIQIMQKVYPIIAGDADTLFDFIAGSSLVPYMEKIPEARQHDFVTEYKNRIQKAFGRFPAIYAFKRLLLYGRKSSK